MATKEPSVFIEEDRYERVETYSMGIYAQRMAKRASLAIFNSYDTSKWEKTKFDPSGGFVVTEWDRIARGGMNKQEREKYTKEKEMCLAYASFGFQIEHLGEESGVSSSDTRVVGHATAKGLVRVNGMLADLKSTSSANNVVKYASKAIHKQGAQIVLFEFTKKGSEFERSIDRLRRSNYHGFYYYKGENRFYRI